jgi:toxin FitB
MSSSVKAHDSTSPPQARHVEIAQAAGVGLTRYLIDTNVVSETRKPRPQGAALAWLQSLELGQGFSAVTFGEIQKGVELARQQDAVKANEIEAWATQLERASQVLPMDAACFREYARLIHGRSNNLVEDENDAFAHSSCTAGVRTD